MPELPKQIGMQNAVIGGLILAAAGFFVGTNTALLEGATATSSSPAATEAELAPLFEAWGILDENFAPATTTHPVTRQEQIWGAISGLTASYGDPYTVFLPPQEKEIFESSIQGDFEGVGMEIGIRDEVLTVIAPLKGTPAYRAGMLSGDRILKIDDTDTYGLTVEKAVSIIRGPKGTSVSFLVQRGDEEPFTIAVVRDRIALPTIETEYRNDAVFVIRVYSFNAAAPELFRDAIAEFADTGSNKLIIDLRGNPGGFLEVAVDMASWFFPVGTPIVIEDFSGDEEERIYRSRGYDVFTNQLKLAVLIDQGSASASEIFAGAIRDLDKGTLIGETSFGKGSVQQLFDVGSDSSLKVTIARWLTPDRHSISESGIKPDIEVKITDEDRKAGRDPQTEKAAEYLKSL